MKNYEILIKGVDFDFQGASKKTLNQITNEFGGESRFDFSNQRVTYMLSDPYVVPVSKLVEIHKQLNQIGKSVSKRFGCRYVRNEIYLTTDHETVDKLLEIDIDFSICNTKN